MYNFGNKLKLNDEYFTPKEVWSAIEEYIPKNKIIWEPFYGDGKSGIYLRELGFNVIHEPIDFFENNEGDILVSNPPFSIRKEILSRLVILNKPFIMIMPVATLTTQYLANTIKEERLQIIIPKKRIQFYKIEKKKIVNTKQCSFDCAYFCYKMNLKKDIIWLK